jgi:hypothetical protein
MNKIKIAAAIAAMIAISYTAAPKCSDLPAEPLVWDKATVELYATCK